jgi:hypothetical protein
MHSTGPSASGRWARSFHPFRTGTGTPGPLPDQSVNESAFNERNRAKSFQSPIDSDPLLCQTLSPLSVGHATTERPFSPASEHG